jgi:hypothetical protein
LASNLDSTVDFRTDLDFVGDKTFTVTFRPDTRYAYACEPHWQVMNGVAEETINRLAEDLREFLRS